MLSIPQQLEVDPAFAPMLRLTDAILLTPGEVARHLRVSVGHLGHMRRAGDGPRHVLINRHVRYRHSDVLAYEIGRTAGPVTPDALALAVAALPRVPPDVRDFFTAHLTAVLFPPSAPRAREKRTVRSAVL